MGQADCTEVVAIVDVVSLAIDVGCGNRIVIRTCDLIIVHTAEPQRIVRVGQILQVLCKLLGHRRATFRNLVDVCIVICGVREDVSLHETLVNIVEGDHVFSGRHHLGELHGVVAHLVGSVLERSGHGVGATIHELLRFDQVNPHGCNLVGSGSCATSCIKVSHSVVSVGSRQDGVVTQITRVGVLVNRPRERVQQCTINVEVEVIAHGEVSIEVGGGACSGEELVVSKGSVGRGALCVLGLAHLHVEGASVRIHECTVEVDSVNAEADDVTLHDGVVELVDGDVALVAVDHGSLLGNLARAGGHTHILIAVLSPCVQLRRSRLDGEVRVEGYIEALDGIAATRSSAIVNGIIVRGDGSTHADVNLLTQSNGEEVESITHVIRIQCYVVVSVLCGVRGVLSPHQFCYASFCLIGLSAISTICSLTGLVEAVAERLDVLPHAVVAHSDDVAVGRLVGRTLGGNVVGRDDAAGIAAGGVLDSHCELDVVVLAQCGSLKVAEVHAVLQLEGDSPEAVAISSSTGLAGNQLVVALHALYAHEAGELLTLRVDQRDVAGGQLGVGGRHANHERVGGGHVLVLSLELNLLVGNVIVSRELRGLLAGNPHEEQVFVGQSVRPAVCTGGVELYVGHHRGVLTDDVLQLVLDGSHLSIDGCQVVGVGLIFERRQRLLNLAQTTVEVVQSLTVFRQLILNVSDGAVLKSLKSVVHILLVSVVAGGEVSLHLVQRGSLCHGSLHSRDVRGVGGDKSPQLGHLSLKVTCGGQLTDLVLQVVDVVIIVLTG